MTSYKEGKRKSIRKRAETLKVADAFASETFIALRKDDTCWKRFLRYFRLMPPQKIKQIENEKVNKKTKKQDG